LKILIRLLINASAVMAGAYILKGVHVDGWVTAAIVAIVIGVLNAFLRPILVFLTFPITLVTLGLFVFVINGALILLAAQLVPGFKIDNFWWALIFGLAVSIINSFLHSIQKK